MATDGEELVEVPDTGAGAGFSMPAANSRDEYADIDELSSAMSEGKKKFLDELDRIEALTDVVERADAIANLETNIGKYFDGGDAEANAMMKILQRRLTNEK